MIVHAFTGLLIEFLSHCKVVVPDETTAPKRLLYLLCLGDIGIDAELIAVLHFGTLHILLILYVLLND